MGRCVRRWLALVLRDAMGASVDEDAETDEQTLDRWADEMTGEAMAGEALILHRKSVTGEKG